MVAVRLVPWAGLFLAALYLGGALVPSVPGQEPAGRRPPGRPGLVLPGKPVGPPPGRQGREAPITTEQLHKQLLILANTPQGSPRALAVLDQLLAYPEEDVLTWLAPVLRQSRSSHLKGALQVLRALNSPEGARLIRETLVSGPFRGPIQDVLEIALDLDPDGTQPFLIQCLGRPERELRLHAESLLRGRIAEADLESLAELARSPRADTRLRVLRLLFGARLPGAVRIFVAALGDEAAGCAHLAAQGLARLPSLPAEIGQVLAAGPTQGGRAFCFALLAMILKDEAGPERALDPALKPMLLEGVRGQDPLASSLSAVALARLSFFSEDLTGEPFQDTLVMGLLVEVLSTQRFFPEFGAILPVLERAAQLLSGLRGGVTARAWTGWWEAHRDGFAASRASFPLDLEERRRRTVVVLADPIETFVIRSSDTTFPVPQGAREIRVTPEKQNDLIEALRRQGLLEAANATVPSVSGDTGRTVRLSLWLAGRELRLEALAGGGGLDRFISEVHRLIDANLWQLYAPEAEPARELWLARMEEWFATASAGERERKIKDLVLERLAQLEGVRRIRALGHLLAIPEIEKVLEDGDVDLLLAGVGQSQEIDEQVRAVVEVAALGAGTESWAKIIDYLTARWSYGGEQTLRQLLARSGPARLKALFDHGDGRLKSLTARHVGRQRDPSWTPTLKALLRDSEAHVRASAVWALARLGDGRAAQEIQALARLEGSPLVQREILFFAGEVPFAGSMELLMRGLSASDLDLRLTAIRAFGRSRLPRAADVLAGLVASDPTNRSGRLASEVLSAWGGPNVRAAVRLLLKHQNPRVREEATWILAEVLDGGVVSTLLDWLRDPAREARARTALVGIACIDFPREPAAGFRRWYEQRGSLPEAAWFVEGLRAAGYPLTFGVPDLLPGAGLGAANELIALLEGAREWYFRVQAARRLQELTGLDFGTVTAATPRPTLEAIAQSWESWLSAQETVKK